MRRRLQQIWQQDDGSAKGLEWVFVASVMVLGSIAALMAIRRAFLGH
jgi:hypothetical protein